MRLWELRYQLTVLSFSVLLKSYVEQRDEMLRLKKEADDLERELDSVTRLFEQAAEKYNKCNST